MSSIKPRTGWRPNRTSHESWLERKVEHRREARDRADTIATAIFLLGGGALSVSIATLIGSSVGRTIASIAEGRVFWGWLGLVLSIMFSVLFKTVIVIQSYFLPRGYPHKVPHWFRRLSVGNIILGAAAVISFLIGILCLFAAALVLLEAPNAGVNV